MVEQVQSDESKRSLASRTEFATRCAILGRKSQDQLLATRVCSSYNHDLSVDAEDKPTLETLLTVVVLLKKRCANWAVKGGFGCDAGNISELIHHVFCQMI